MSLFFEDEIRKAMQRAADEDLDNFLSQDPRRKLNRNRRNQNPFHMNRNTNGSRQNPYKRRNRLWNEDDDN